MIFILAAALSAAQPASLDSLDRALAKLDASGGGHVSIVYSLRQSAILDGIDEILTREDRHPLVQMIGDEHELRIASFAESAARLGGAVEWTARISALVSVSASKEAHLRLLGDVNVVDASADVDTGAEPHATYTGDHSRNGVDLNQAFNVGWNGNAGNRITESLPVVIAIMEADAPGTPNKLFDHPGYDDSSNGVTRVKRKSACLPPACVADTFAPSSAANTHGNTVASVALGDITQGQDPNPSLTVDDRKARTGAAKEADLYYYRLRQGANGAHAPSVVLALEDALDADADVANLSFALGSADVLLPCRADFNPAGLNTTIDTSTLLGLSIVASAGNLGTGGACNIGYPALRPSVIAAGSLLTTQSGVGVPAYGSTGIDTSASAQGGLPIVVNGTARTTAAVGLVAPGRRIFAFDRNISYTGSLAGTSYAAPAVAGTIASWKHMAVSQSVPFVHSARLTKTFFLLMADRFDGSSKISSGTSPIAGHGRLKSYILPTDSRLGDPAKLLWAAQTVTLSSIGTTSVAIGTLDSEMRRVKAVAWWNESGDLTDCADIKLRLVDSCNGSTSISDNSFNLSKQVTSTSPANDCLTVQLDAVHLPSQRKVYLAWMASTSTEL
jgi:hypothetical protein